MYDQDIKEFAQAQEQKLIDALGNKREHPDSYDEVRDRDSYQRDYARILYSSSFRRLQGKMQLFEVDPEKFNRNRLTHSLEVAQIARSIAADLGLQNHVVVELAALAHDIGNPPFGHSGEKLLNELSSDIGGYEGNAQALRILRKLEKKYAHCAGLDLTYRSLLAVIKYPLEKKEGVEKFLYNDDYAFYKRVVENGNLQLEPGEKTIDAQIMDLADEIAYAAHDLEDALSRNMVTIEDIEYEFRISEEYQDALKDFCDIVSTSKEIASQAISLRSSEEFAMIFRKELTSTIVNRLVRDISVVSGESGFQELGFGKLQKLSEGLKKRLFKVIMRKRNILTYEFKGNTILKELYCFYTSGENYKFLSPELKFSLPEKESDDFEPKKQRAVVDYISGMMDTFAIKEWETHCRK
ncbi:dNTP triphosphohydrolase [Pantoea sp. Mb-10]|uniref:deoxyguanosinetriphosphate triphosphohydrolase family protein n=1 Tax=unclassified Pantoea TaxID=2630326 RepID=UPI001E3C0AB0|nr:MULTISPECIES: dNTP triphosphohydrolase [unclassified Pantoea]MCE0490926.1 dNTP triphosphohydrolase [Pantoea sp. Mb-10]MCE0499916.1 dNTP triphosphohydrolase [Pantoea sp. Pb-8]